MHRIRHIVDDCMTRRKPSDCKTVSQNFKNLNPIIQSHYAVCGDRTHDHVGLAPPFTAGQKSSLAKDSSHGSNPLPVLAAKLPHRLDSFRTFINARVKCPAVASLPVKVSPQALTVRKEESAIHGLPAQRDDVVRRLAKLLMLTNARKLPFYVVNVEM
ncbi:hypothetical protein WN943_003290 [Citrus x changshan-huyou]